MATETPIFRNSQNMKLNAATFAFTSGSRFIRVMPRARSAVGTTTVAAP